MTKPPPASEADLTGEELVAAAIAMERRMTSWIMVLRPRR